MIPEYLLFDNVRYKPLVVAPEVIYTGWRVLHWGEGGYPNPTGMPCVRPAINAPAIPMNQKMQLLSYELNRMNLNYTKKNWRAVHGNTVAFTNGNGFGKKNDPRADFVNRLDMTKPLPKLMKALICSGMFIRGDVVGNTLVCKPGVHGIDVNKTLPSVDDVVANNWYFTATTGGKSAVYNFPQGGGGPVLMPYFLKEPVAYPLTSVEDGGYKATWFARWNETFLPDPLKFYL